MRAEHAVIIGAGPAGLAAAAALGSRGLASPVLERGAGPAESWRTRPEKLRLNSRRRSSQFRGLRYPRGTGTFPGRDEVIEYFTRYASLKRIDIRTGTTVQRVDAHPGGWLLQTSAGPLEARHVVVATGLFATPVMPPWPDLESFRGTAMHSAGYRNAAPFAGRDVVVAGAGTTAMEIAAELVAGGARSVALAVRTPPNLVPRIFGALPGVKLMLRLPTALGDAQMRVLRRRLIGNLEAHGLPEPSEGPFALLKRTGAGPATVDPEPLAAIRDGSIRVVGAVAGFGRDSDQVLLADGSWIHADVLIAATGFRPGLESMLGHLDVLDEAGIPDPDRTEANGLHFIGFDRVPGQLVFCPAAARVIARKITADRPRS
ncbi:NAD(P)/FAD-dependent oxidoreductase [Paeniglutamicibacter psychrophenolicus]|uniref:Cation diffusion facilitator CzcD-associated flavoprotein CzcO n=1 Tax=Paeniglutamicibacter psychrophenolicus TaxID=257454 RepID=A0ABS4WG12_9MICC|nr:NAD(P)/FAD-dependent oxidoreductase [Paeniglutamicibacter psychrophenolicus]MBP2375154.1 cation diffusion facilitator CzcD-associated flavoprotein CzcO [Paeniglutamicibacter psychrophenolicus]